MNDEPTEMTLGNPAPESVDYSARKFRVVLLLLAWSAIAGVLVCFLPEEYTPLNIVVAVPFLILGIMWCYEDAAEHDHEIGRLTKVLLVLMFAVGFPLYVFQTRGLQGFKTLVWALLFMAALGACFLFTGVATLSAGEALGYWEVVE